MANLTTSEEKILDTLYASGADGLPRHKLCKSVHLTQRGFSIVASRMEDRRLIGRMDNANLTITFGGMRELGVSA